MSNILIIHHYASTPQTGGIGRHHYLARELAKLGHAVTLVGARRHHLLRDPANAGSLPTDEEIDGYRFLRLDVPSHKHAHDPRRVLAWLIFAIRLMLLRRKLDAKPDTVLYSSPQLLGYLGAERLARACGARLVFEVRDIWPMTLVELGGHSLRHPFIRFLEWIERRAYTNADCVVSNLEGSVEHMVEKGMDREKFVWVPNGVPLETANNTTPLSQEILEKIPSDGFRIVYAGTIGLANALDTLVEAAKLLQDFPDIRLIVAGDGRARSALEARCEDLQLTNMTFLGAIPKDQIQSLLTQADACVISTLKSPLYEFGTSPNKIFDYMYSGRPTISLYSGRYDLIKRYRAGLQVPAQDAHACSEAIKSLYSMSSEERMTMGKNGRRAILDELNYERLVLRLMTALDGRVIEQNGVLR